MKFIPEIKLKSEKIDSNPQIFRGKALKELNFSNNSREGIKV